MTRFSITNNSQYVIKIAINDLVYDLVPSGNLNVDYDENAEITDLLIWKLSPDYKEEFDIGPDIDKPLFTKKVVYRCEKTEIYGTATLVKLNSPENIIITDTEQKEDSLISNTILKRFVCSLENGKELESETIFMSNSTRDKIAENKRTASVIVAVISSSGIFYILYQIAAWYERDPEFIDLLPLIWVILIAMSLGVVAFDSYAQYKKYKKARLFGEVFNKMKK